MASRPDAPTRLDVDEIIAETMNLDSDQIRPETTLVDDLNIDSLDLAVVGLAFEDAFGIELKDETCKGWETVGDIYTSLGVQL